MSFLKNIKKKMKKTINNLSPIISAIGIVLMFIPWLFSAPAIGSMVPVGFAIALLGLFVDFKFVEDRTESDVIDDLDEDEEQVQIDDYLKSEQFIKDFKEQIKKDTWDHGLPMAYMNNKKQLVHHWKDGRIEIIKNLNNEADKS